MVRSRSRATSLLMVLLLVAGLGVALFGSVVQAQEGPEDPDGGPDGNETTDGEGTSDGDQEAGGEAGDGQQGGAGYDYVLNLRENPFDHQQFNIVEYTIPAGSRVLMAYDSTGAEFLHNSIPVEEDIGAENVEVTGEPIEPDTGQSFSVFTVPEDAADGSEFEYFCVVHATTMRGTITVGETFASGEPAGGGGGEQITHVGVHYLAHWVGIISFAVLFIVYGATFFLFKYNETGFATDHKDRAVPAGAGGTDRYGQDIRVTKSTATVIALLLLVLAIALVYMFAGGVFAGSGV